jgi:serine/threonine protein kinase
MQMRLYTELMNMAVRDVIEAQRPRRLADALVVQILRHAAEALKYLHSLPTPIAHLDVKAENVFVSATGGVDLTGGEGAEGDGTPRGGGAMSFNFVCKLADFDEMVDMRPDQQLEHNIGTPEFMAPEMITLQRVAVGKPYDVRADLWSYGMFVFELLTGEVPYRSENIRQFHVAAHIASGARPKCAVVEDPAPGQATKTLVGLFELCTSVKAANRPSARRIVKTLGTAARELVGTVTPSQYDEMASQVRGWGRPAPKKSAASSDDSTHCAAFVGDASVAGVAGLERLKPRPGSMTSGKFDLRGMKAGLL